MLLLMTAFFPMSEPSRGPFDECICRPVRDSPATISDWGSARRVRRPGQPSQLPQNHFQRSLTS
jgi:hypothetical protein